MQTSNVRCYRLYPAQDFLSLKTQRKTEISWFIDNGEFTKAAVEDPELDIFRLLATATADF